MKREPTESESDMLDEYDFSGGVRGKYSDRYRAGTNLVVIDRDLVDLFPTAEAVNNALRALATIARQAAKGDL